MTYRRAATLETLRNRARMLGRVREFFAARGVLEVETPALSPAAPTDPALSSIVVAARCLSVPHYLHTSPELAMKRLLADGAGDVYQICRVFRDDELGRWHQPEFTMVEWYRVGWDDARLIGEVEELVRHAFAGTEARGTAWPTVKLSYAEAFASAMGVEVDCDGARLAGRLAALGVDVPPGLDHDALLDLAFATVVAPGFRRDALTFVHGYPATQAALARIEPGPPPVAARFELFAGGEELANGFAELTDAREQQRRFEADLEKRRAAGLPTPPVDVDFVAALGGLPECAGVALGFDRLVSVASRLPSVAAAMAFAHVQPAG